MIRLVLSLLSLAAFAEATVVTNTMCTATGFASVSNPTSCSIATNVAPSANTHASISPGSLTVTTAGVNSGFGPSQVQAIPMLPGPNGPATNASASATGSLLAELATAGPVRPGFIDISESVELGDGLGGPSVGTADVAIGSLNTACTAIGGALPASADCSGALGAINGTGPPQKFAFTLGQTFLFSEDISLFGSLNSNDLSIDGNSSANGSLLVSFSFVDANGAPVEVYAVPEPSSLAMLLIAGSILAGIRLVRRRN